MTLLTPSQPINNEEFARAQLPPYTETGANTLGCVLGAQTWTGVNARNFDPEQLGNVRIRLLDGAKTWKYLG